MRDYLDAMFDSEDDNVCLLYKYRSSEQHHLNCLQSDTLWFSAQPQLNDPFDCVVRLPDTIGPNEIAEVRSRLAGVSAYDLDISDPGEVAQYIGASADLPPLVPLGLMAAQSQDAHLLRHIREPVPSDDRWIENLVIMARDLVQRLLQTIAVFCLSEPNNHSLMWAHYAASHSGFCTGYVSPVGIENPALIRKVRYVQRPPMITPWQLVDDPSSVCEDLVLTKSAEWSYESEWRMTFGNMTGIVDSPLPYREVIFGAKIVPETEMAIRQAVGDRDIRFLRVITDSDGGQFEIRVVPD